MLYINVKLPLNIRNEYINFSKVFWCKLSFKFRKMETENSFEIKEKTVLNWGEDGGVEEEMDV